MERHRAEGRRTCQPLLQDGDNPRDLKFPHASSQLRRRGSPAAPPHISLHLLTYSRCSPVTPVPPNNKTRSSPNSAGERAVLRGCWGKDGTGFRGRSARRGATYPSGREPRTKAARALGSPFGLLTYLAPRRNLG